MKDYYYILGLNRDASPEQIKSAYRKLSLKFHPDKNDGDKFFEERFKEIQEAYETLSNPDRKRMYDSKSHHSTNRQQDNSHEEKLKRDFEEELKRRKAQFDEELKKKEREHAEHISELNKKRKPKSRKAVLGGMLLILTLAGIFLYYRSHTKEDLVNTSRTIESPDGPATTEALVVPRSDTRPQAPAHISDSAFDALFEDMIIAETREIDSIWRLMDDSLTNSWIYKIEGTNYCAIDKGALIIGDVVDDKFNFSIKVVNSKGYSGSIKGTATFTGEDKAIFTGENNCRLTFDFKNDDDVRILEENGMAYHGANICFSGTYVK